MLGMFSVEGSSRSYLPFKLKITYFLSIAYKFDAGGEGNAVIVTVSLVVKERAGCRGTFLRIWAVYKERVLPGISFMFTRLSLSRLAKHFVRCNVFAGEVGQT